MESIGTYAFRNCDEMTIYGEAGTYAETYANANDIPFVNIKDEGTTEEPKIELKTMTVEFYESSSRWYFDVSVADYAGEATVYAAVYDTSGKMLTMTSDALMIEDITTLGLPKSGNGNAAYAKIFVWVENARPITLAEQIDF